MKKTLENGEDKIQEICDILRRKTLEPAKSEAQNIIDEAKLQADQIIRNAQQHAEQLINDARRSIDQERNVFNSSLHQAGKQAMEALKHEIENKLLNHELHNLIVKNTTDPKIIANLISAIVKAIEKEGLSVDLSAIIPREISAKDIVQYLGQEVLKKLKEGPIAIGDFAGGTKVRLEGKKIVFDISDAEIENLVRGYVRKDFRKLMFIHST